MSPRTDSYLSLCLEQASKSTLHYRHGCVIVHGGKVIGQGYNAYRPGFNGGGILKTGRLSPGASSSPAILDLKQKRNPKPEQPFPGGKSLLLRVASTETRDCAGARCLTRNPLSMHSEMMAIQSALSLSSNTTSYGSARSSTLMRKPGPRKLPGRGKPQLRLRNVKDYVDTACGKVVAAEIQNENDVATMQRGVGAQDQDCNNKAEKNNVKESAQYATVNDTTLDCKKYQNILRHKYQEHHLGHHHYTQEATNQKQQPLRRHRRPDETFNNAAVIRTQDIRPVPTSQNTDKHKAPRYKSPSISEPARTDLNLSSTLSLTPRPYGSQLTQIERAY